MLSWTTASDAHESISQTHENSLVRVMIFSSRNIIPLWNIHFNIEICCHVVILPNMEKLPCLELNVIVCLFSAVISWSPNCKKIFLLSWSMICHSHNRNRFSWHTVILFQYQILCQNCMKTHKKRNFSIIRMYNLSSENEKTSTWHLYWRVIGAVEHSSKGPAYNNITIFWVWGNILPSKIWGIAPQRKILPLNPCCYGKPLLAPAY